MSLRQSFSPEIVLFGALIFLLATGLALSSPGVPTSPRRLLIYAFLGFVIGLALWIDQLILPIVAAAGLLLLIFCYREALWAGLCLIAGGAIGGGPLLIYNIYAPAGQNSLDVLLFLNRVGADKVVARHISLVQQWLGAFLISLPVATGANPCHRTDDLPILGSPADSPPCIALQGTWATGLTLL